MSAKLKTLSERLHVFLKLQEKEKQHATYSYLISIFIVSIPISLALFISHTLHKQDILFLFLPAVAISVWYGEMKTGLITLLLSFTAIDYLISSPKHPFLVSDFGDIIVLLLFLVAGTLISYFIDKCKQINDVAVFKQREKEYIQLLSDYEKEDKKSKEEIKARDEFLSIASHELKTPITSMLLQIQNMLHKIRSVSLAQFSVENLLQMLESAESQSQRVARMINDLLNVSLITSGRMELEFSDTNLSHVTKEIVQSFAEKLKEENISLKTNIAENVTGHWDKLRLSQVITNLLTNAIKYGRSKPIIVTLEKHGNSAYLTVEDKGIGIPYEMQEKIFRRFERAVSNHDYQGLGVGLYITSTIVKAHRGSIKIKSEENEGSVFTVELPIK